ncbi:MAG TPA: response regulator, partial [Thermoplasmata archaeon]|nr:response regulator [Thermoplasmata archaeon]
MSHELRTPLNSIIGFSEVLLNKSFGELTPQQEEFLHDIHNAGKHLLELINEILDLSKIEAGRMDLHIQTLDLETLVEEVQEVVRPLYTRKGLSFSVDIPDDLPKVRGDALRLKQVLYNLISNAIKFTPSYGLVRVIARPVRDMVRVDVIDTGIGIKKKNYETIFREFTQLDMSVSREHEGTGLGLPLAKKLVELHGGRIWFKSVVGAGSTFSFTIPQATPKDEGVLSSADTGIPVSRPEAAPASPKAPRPAPATGKADAVTAPSWERIRRPAARVETPGPERPPSRARKPEKISRPPVPDIGRSKVLIIDDSEETRDFLEGILREEGYDVIKAVDGESGVRKARQLSPFAILLDILLPDINGWDVLKYLKENEETADIPVIIVSVLDNAYKGISLGAVDFFVKPVDRDRLLARLKKLAITPREEGAPMRILVVDDQPQAVKLVATVLESEGYEVLKAYGGIQGLDLARSKRPDLIILDLVMPDMSGMEVLAELKKDPATREIPVMVLTAKHLSKRDIAEMKENVLSITKKEDFSRDRLLRERLRQRLRENAEVVGTDELFFEGDVKA